MELKHLQVAIAIIQFGKAGERTKEVKEDFAHYKKEDER
jgi:hypothetical protein